MAYLGPFLFLEKDSPVHAMDPRAKAALLAVLGACAMAGPPRLAVGAFGLALSGLVASRLPMGRTVRGLLPLAPLLFLVVLARGLYGGGEGGPAVGWFSVAGLAEGLLFAFRLGTVAVLGAVFTGTTRPGAVREAVRWFLSPVPLVPENRVAMMMGLTVRLVPVVLEEASRTRAALAARGLESRKNSLVRVRVLGACLVRRVILCADRFSLALASRGWSENRCAASLTLGRADVAAACLAALAMALAWFLPSLAV
ncbi:MAG: energy-coupling factor transporter transmembrane protein EcfT [Deltaproteobacteria bacterium]|nr:energy-coupling factor transporter transmembrane protein EcfT [Deltaproteobacteria bacterium]